MPETGPCGFLNVAKPAGPTSSEVVERVRRALGAPCGHAGTLDPPAEGVLVLAIGPARKFITYLEDEKTYEAVVRFGVESDTGDRTGVPGPTTPVPTDPAAVRAAGLGLVGDLALPVPMYSAVHVGGRRLYEFARAGVAVEPPVRTMRVLAFAVDAVELPVARCTVTCASGTYVRALATEWGRRLGCGAWLDRLVRTRAGAFTLDRSRALADIEAAGAAAADWLVPIPEGLAHLPRFELEEDAARRLRLGQAVAAPAGVPSTAGAFGSAVRAGGGWLGVVRVGGGPSPRLEPDRLPPEGVSIP